MRASGGYPGLLVKSQKWVGPERLTTALILGSDRFIPTEIGEGAGRIQHYPRSQGPTCGATNKIDAAVALRIGQRGHNLTFEVIGLIGKAAGGINGINLTVQRPRRRKTVINLKDKEARLLEVIARIPRRCEEGW